MMFGSSYCSSSSRARPRGLSGWFTVPTAPIPEPAAPPPQIWKRNSNSSSPGVSEIPSLTWRTALRPGTPESEFTRRVMAWSVRITSCRLDEA